MRNGWIVHSSYGTTQFAFLGRTGKLPESRENEAAFTSFRQRDTYRI